MGTVYLVEEIDSKIRYALKTILISSASEKNLKRFEMETKATKLLNHPSLVQIYDYGLINENQPYFVMDYCDGKDLSEILKTTGALSVERALDVFIVICNALAYAHTQGVVHRDLKPSNIMLCGSEVKVLDFGIAKVFLDGTEYNTITQTGEIFGSPQYMSPEQCLGKVVDRRSDIYSLGCMFFEALTGGPPFTGETSLAVMLKHQSETPLTLKEAMFGAEFSADLEKIVSSMLAKNPAHRYPDLLRVADDLKHVQKGEDLESLQPEREKAKPLNKGILVITVLAIALVLVTAQFLMRPQEKDLKVHTAIDSSKHLPSPEAMRQMTVAPKEFYSVLKPGNSKVRDFHFPQTSFGDFGYGDDPKKYIPMRGSHASVKIPFRIHVELDPKAISGFRNDEVEQLTLKGIVVDDKSTDPIRNWRELTLIDMDDTEITDYALANMKGLSKLNTLAVNDTHVTGNGLLNLPLARLTLLALNRVRDAKLILPRLRHSKVKIMLNMVGDDLNDEDLKLLAQIPQVAVLDIRQNRYSDKGIEYLVGLKQVEHLSIDGSNITPRCARKLKNLILKSLTVEHSKWTGDEQLAFKHALKESRSNEHMDIKFTGSSGD